MFEKSNFIFEAFAKDYKVTFTNNSCFEITLRLKNGKRKSLSESVFNWGACGDFIRIDLSPERIESFRQVLHYAHYAASYF
jgi:hypothetical protein